MPTILERANALRNRQRRVTNQDPEQAIIGDAFGVMKYDTTPPGCIECRVITSNGLSGPRPIFFPKNVNITPSPGATVYVGLKYGRECILDPNTIGDLAVGVDSMASTLAAQSSSVPQSGLATLKCIASATPDTFVHLQAWNVIINGVYYDVFGLSVNLAADIPTAGNMGFIVVAVTQGFDIEYVASTPRPIDPGDALDADDVNDALPSLSIGSTPVWAVALMDDQATITQANIDNMPSRDLRQTVNVASTGGTISASGTATLVLGVATVSTTAVTANSLIFLTAQETGTYTGFLRVSARSAGVSFGIASSVLTDTAVVAWQILEP